jgi:hypothetical protein
MFLFIVILQHTYQVIVALLLVVEGMEQILIEGN